MAPPNYKRKPFGIATSGETKKDGVEVHILFNLTHANKHDIQDARFELEKSHLST